MTASAPPVSLVDFLTARLDEIEAKVREAVAPPWPGHEKPTFYTTSFDRYQDDWGLSTFHVPTEYVLADIAAKRQIFAECCISLENKAPGYDGTQRFAYQILRLLASAYRDHPEWQEAWQ